MTQIKNIKFIPEIEIEKRANSLLGKFESEFGKLTKPPIPIDKLIEKFLDLHFDWDDIEEDEDEKILGCLLPNARKIMMNSRHIDFFNKYWGTETYTKAHEVGHWDLHITKPGDAVQLGLPGFSEGNQYLCRNNGNESREIQAEIYASYLLMPNYLIMQEINNLELTKWHNIYALRDLFSVSITAMKNRLTALGLIYVCNDVIYRSIEEAQGIGTLF